MENFIKTVRPGLVDCGWEGAPKLRSVFVTIEYRDGRLSITAVEGPRANGDCAGACGQANELAVVDFAEGWDAAQVDQLRAIWKRWHLNAMRAGSPAQSEWLRANEAQWEADRADASLWSRENGGPGYPDHYTWAKAGLARAGLQPDPATGYSYGSAWLREEVPQEVLDWLRALPDSDRTLPRAWERKD